MRNWILMITLVVLSPVCLAAGINCDKANSKTKILICSNALLVGFDQDVDLLFQETYEHISNSFRTKLQKDHQAWLKAREEGPCLAEYSCLTFHFERIVELKRWFQTDSPKRNQDEKILNYFFRVFYLTESVLQEIYGNLEQYYQGNADFNLYSFQDQIPAEAPLLMEKLSGFSVYLKGPHHIQFNFDSEDTFGHYNPQFVNWLQSMFDEMRQDSNWNKLLRYLYGDVRPMTRAFYRMYYWVHAPGRKQWFASKKARYFSHPEEREMYDVELDKKLYDLMDGYNNAELHPSDAIQAIRFWIRRSVDGTDQQFFKLLSDIMNAYDGEYAVQWKEW